MLLAQVYFDLAELLYCSSAYLFGFGEAQLATPHLCTCKECFGDLSLTQQIRKNFIGLSHI